MENTAKSIEERIESFVEEVAAEGYTVVANFAKVNSDKAENNVFYTGTDKNIFHVFQTLQENFKKDVVPELMPKLLVQEIFNELNKDDDGDKCGCPNCSPENYTDEELSAYKEAKEIAEELIKVVTNAKEDE